jgi:hypothetical protein
MNKILIIILFLSAKSYLSFSQNGKYVCWINETKLSISNFHQIFEDSVEERYRDFGALSFIHMKYVHPYKVVTVFDTEYSWILKELLDDSIQVVRILNHEQKHFDIAELYTRKARNEIQKIVNNKNNSAFLSNILYKIDSELFNYQQKYDFETNNGLNSKNQSYWNKKIEKELKILERFKSTELDCRALKQ